MSCTKRILTVLLFAAIPVAADSLIDVNNYRPLSADRKAFRVGEPIVVVVVESTTAESSAGTGSRSNVSIQGRAFDGAGSHEAGVGLSGQGDGAGQTTRKGRAFSQLSTRIVETQLNGLFRISGEQNLIINGEHQKIILSGIIRSEDISRDNSILSHRIADAQIEISGDGDVSEAQRQSIIYRVLQWLQIL